ncbi:MAG: Brp/Blh family beta-carotene 15,15'-dioxygenase [Rhodococcus sp. (in: high G+C Gram-positive bacteria)]
MTTRVHNPISARSPMNSRAIRTRLFTPVIIGFSLLAAVCATGVHIPDWVQYVPFATSLVILGLPHGAADHLVPAWLRSRRQSAASIMRVVALYGVLAAAALAMWVWAPAAAAIGFIALTWFHWGQGDLYVLRAVDNSDYLTGRRLRSAAVVIRGGLPMLVPLVFHPDVYREFLVATVGLFDGSMSLDVLGGLGARATVCAVFVAVIVATGAITYRRAVDRSVWWRDQVEVGVLLFFFAAVPPILAIGLYFSMWHALRHFVRLDLIAGSPYVTTPKRIARMARACAPTTALAIVFLVMFALVIPRAANSGVAALGLYLVLVSMLTVPHVAVVSYMDYRQRVWSG